MPDLLGRFGVVDIPTGISSFGNRHRAYVKVQDGCLLRCSYCIIPKVRPHLRSRPVGHIVDEVRRLVANGYREVVLTGIHLGHFGVDWNVNRPKKDWIRLADLVRRLVQIKGHFRIRLSSIEAIEVTRDLISTMEDFPDEICPHLHVCLQSGADSVLRRMRRRWCAKRFVDRCQMVQEALDQPALTTDVIVGFPGETEQDFDATCEVVRQVGFSKIHVFPFSARQSTPAASMPEQISPEVRSQRCRQLAAIESELREEYYRSLLGRHLSVLVESCSDDKTNGNVGTSCRYVPVEFRGTSIQIGRFATVMAMKATADRIVGHRLISH